MEDEVQLQSLAKRLINIYNACKWSKTKLHLRKKKRTNQNCRQLEEHTDVETDSSARTVFVYNRRKTKEAADVSIVESRALRKYFEENLDDNRAHTERLHEQYCNDQSINVCSCRKCCCDPGKPRYEIVDKRKSAENKKKGNSGLVVSLTPTHATKDTTRGCCCSTQQSNGASPPLKKKSIIKSSNSPPMPNRDCMCQCGPLETPPIQPPACSSEPFCPYYPPPPKVTKAATSQRPASTPQKKCCECPPSPPNVSCCCQCPPPAPPVHLCCQCPPSPPSTSGCCQCPPPSPPSSFGCCQCPPSPIDTSDCCQCEPFPAASFGCQCCPPPPCCCDIEEYPPEDDFCCCQSGGTNGPTVICADKIIIPTCFFNEGEQSTGSGNLSGAISEEVKNELLNDYRTSDKQINTSCVVINSCTSSFKRALAQAQPMPAPAVIPPRTSAVKDSPCRQCRCAKKEQQNQIINTNSCAVVRSCTSSLKKTKPAAQSSDPKCQGGCCKCQKKTSPAQRAPGHPPIHPVLRYPSDQNFVPSSSAGGPPLNSMYAGEERMLAKYSPQPFGNQIYPPYGAHPYVSNYAAPPLYGGMVPPRPTDLTAVLRSQSTPLCCNQAPNGGGDDRIAGINADTEAAIYATLQKIEYSLRDEADMHSRNMRCIVDQVCKQGGEIKELKVLVTGVVEEKKAPSCKQVEKKIKKLDKRKRNEAKKKREREMEEREERRREKKENGENVEEVSSNLCCKCGEKRKKGPRGCCGKCCAKRCCGLCGKCCGGCCPKCCDKCCFPCEKCCPCCCGLAECCDKCWSCSCFKRRKKKKCKCSK